MKKLFFLLFIANSLFGQAGYIRVPPDSTGKKLATFERTQGSDQVHNQIFSLFSTGGTAVAILNAVPNSTDYGLVVRTAGPVDSSAIRTDQDTTWVQGTSKATVIAGVYNVSDPLFLADQVSALRVNSSGELHVVASGFIQANIFSAIPTGNNNIGDVDVASIVPGSGATNLGKAEDAARGSGDIGVASLGVRKDNNTENTNADSDYGFTAIDSYGSQFVREDHPNRIICAATGIAATLTQMTGCAAAAAGFSYYIKSIHFQSTTATSGTFALQSGTGSNCGTGTTALFPSSATGNRFNAPPTTAGIASVTFGVPIKVTAAHAICLIGVATNTTTLQLTGWVAR